VLRLETLLSRLSTPPQLLTIAPPLSAAVNNQTNEGVAIKKVTNVFSKKILAKRALREIKLLQHFRGHRNVGFCLGATKKGRVC
jgi:hypothetical protein